MLFFSFSKLLSQNCNMIPWCLERPQWEICMDLWCDHSFESLQGKPSVKHGGWPFILQASKSTETIPASNPFSWSRDASRKALSRRKSIPTVSMPNWPRFWFVVFLSPLLYPKQSVAELRLLKQNKTLESIQNQQPTSATSSTSMFIIEIHSVSRQAHSRISSYIVSKSQVQLNGQITISEIHTSTFSCSSLARHFRMGPIQKQNGGLRTHPCLIIWKSSLTFRSFRFCLGHGHD